MRHLRVWGDLAQGVPASVCPNERAPELDLGLIAHLAQFRDDLNQG
jgi:hypothetical protein